MGKGPMVQHNFYCMKCGNRGIPIMRKKGNQKEGFHRKKLYCIFCKEEVNHVECRNEYEVIKFKEKFENGEYKEEAEESVNFIKERSKL